MPPFSTDMPRLHPREQIVNTAEADLRDAVSGWSRDHPDLTSAEWLKIVMSVCHDLMQGLLRTEIRLERHGDADKPGGFE